MFGFLCGLFFGFITGLFSSLFMSLIKKYKSSNYDVKKTAFKSVVSLYVDSIIDNIDNIDNIILPNIEDTLKISTNVFTLAKDYNNKFKIVVQKGKPIIKILDSNYLKDTNFIEILKFFKDNDIELTLTTDNTQELKIKNN